MNMPVVLRGLLDKDSFFRYSEALLKQKSLEREHRQIIQAIRGYWQKYPDVERLTPDELIVHFFQQNPALKNKEYYDDILADVKRSELGNQELLQRELESVLELQYVTRIYHQCVLKLEDQETGVIDKIKLECDQFYEVVGRLEVEDTVVGNVTLDELLAEQQGSYRWRLPFLQEQLGAPPTGTLGHIFATPDTGKTTLAISEAVFMANQMQGTEDKILFLGNEEKMTRTYLRAFSSITGMERFYMEDPENHDEVQEKFKRFTTNITPHLICVDSVSDMYTVEEHIKRFKPKIVFLDQGPKVNYPGDASGPEKLKLLYNWYRETAKKYDIVLITLGQADAKAENKRRLSLQNIDGSKVGIPGELDFAIGVSRIEDPGKEWVRYITICKNKLTGNLGNAPAYLDRLKARYK